MCCVNGLPMQIGLNMLLQQAKPDRLLIEPTGLGHPKQILSLLTSDIYQPWIDLRATLCLLDARQLSEPAIPKMKISVTNWRRQISLWSTSKTLTARPITRCYNNGNKSSHYRGRCIIANMANSTWPCSTNHTVIKTNFLLVHIITAHHSQKD